MFLIFSHIIRNALTSLRRLLLQPKNLSIATGLALLVVVGSSLWSHSAVRSSAQQDNPKGTTKTEQLPSDQSQKSAHAQADSQATNTNQQSDTTNTQNSSGATSSGSSSTNATTGQQSFSTAITRPGQVSAGTLIAYNASKNEKTYYGGDLSLSTTAITISKNNSPTDARSVTITSPDEQVLGVPTSPWDDKSPYFWVATDSSNAKSSGTSFTMFVDFASNVPTGAYQLHLTTGRTQQTADGWRYDGFITITVVD